MPGDIHPGRYEAAVSPGEAEAQHWLIQQQEMPLRKDYFIPLLHIRSQLEWWCKSPTIHKRQQPNEVPIHSTGKTRSQRDISLFFHSFASWWRISTVEQNMEKAIIKISQTKIAPLINRRLKKKNPTEQLILEKRHFRAPQKYREMVFKAHKGPRGFFSPLPHT